MHDGDALLLEQPRREVGAVVQQDTCRRPAADHPGTARVDVEGTLRPVTAQPGGTVQHRHDEIAALAVDGVALGQEAEIAVRAPPPPQLG